MRRKELTAQIEMLVNNVESLNKRIWQLENPPHPKGSKVAANNGELFTVAEFEFIERSYGFNNCYYYTYQYTLIKDCSTISYEYHDELKPVET